MAANRPILYNTWTNIKARCNNPNSVDYKNYGGRGIKICNRWLDFKNFQHDMLPSFKKGLTIDRVNNNGNYELSNCHWTTRKEQNNNTRVNRYIQYKDATKTLSQWAEYLGIKRSTLAQRFYVYKWDLDKCFSYERSN